MKYKDFLTYTFLTAFGLERAIFFIYFDESGHSISQISFLQVLLFVFIFLGEIPTGIFGDIYGKKKSLIVGVTLKAFSLVFQTLFVENYPILVFSFILYAISLSFISGSLGALFYQSIRDNGEESKYSRFLALNEFFDSASLAIAMALGPVIKTYFNWNMVYFLTALINIMSIVFIFKFPKEKNFGETEDHNPFHFGMFFKNAKHLFPVILPISLLHACMTPFFVNSQLLFKELGKGLNLIGQSMGGVEFFGALVVFFLVKVTIKYSKIVSLTGISSFIILVLLNLLGNYWVSLFSFFAINILSIYLSVLLMSHINDIVKNDSIRASTLSFVSFMDTLLISFGYLTFGIISKFFDIKTTITSLAVFPLVGFLILLVSSNNKKEGDKHSSSY